jgi:hypothetical protein
LAGAVLRTAVAQAGCGLLEASFCEPVICLSSQVEPDFGQGKRRGDCCLGYE